jgi:hypothetical protein
MKIHGRKIEQKLIEVVVIPRRDGDLVFKAAPVTDLSDFEKLYPEPQPPVKLAKGVTSTDVNDADYKTKHEHWTKSRGDFMFIKSLLATDGLQFDTVDLSQPMTWANWQTELSTVLTTGELSAVIDIILEANGLNDKKIEAATKSFLAGQQAKQDGK